MIFSSHKTQQRRGYVLLTVVVLIAVALLMLSRIASTSMRLASLAIIEEREMRHRWAVSSLRRHSLDAAPELFAEPSLDQPLEVPEISQPTIWRDVQLADQIWRVIIADESAKLDVARVSLHFGKNAARDLIDDVVSDTTGIQPASDLAQISSSSVGRWESWLNDNGEPVTDPRKIASATRALTLWGDGRLNVRRCDPESLDLLWRLLFGRRAPEELHRDSRQNPPKTTTQLIDSLGLRESQASLAKQWIATNSQCYSLWVFCESDRRLPASFFVEWGHADNAKVYRAYEY